VRYLGNRLYGEWLIIMSLAAYLSLTNLGLAQTVGNRIAEAIACNRRDEVGTLVATAFWTYTMIAIGLIGVLFLGSNVIGHRRLHAVAPEASVAFIIYVALICLAMPGKIYQVTLRGFERVDCEQLLDAGSTVARTVLTVMALVAGFKLAAIALVNGCSSVIAGMLAYWIARHISGGLEPLPRRFSWGCLRSLGSPSAAFLALQAGSTLTIGIDNLVIGAALGGIGVTRYAVPFRLIWMTALVFTVAVNAAMPTITGRYALAQRPALTRYYLIALRIALLFATCGAMLLWTAGPLLIRLWAGLGVFPGPRVFALQITLFGILVVTAPSAAILAATTNHYRYAASTIVEGLLNLALSLLWVRRYGLVGVIGGTIVASLLTTSWYVTLAAPRVIGLARLRMLRHLALPVAISATALTAMIVAGRSVEPFAAFVIANLIAGLVLVVYLALVFDASELRAIRRFLASALSAGSPVSWLPVPADE
jgi:O-antigen/teichoic acid export membrane protein